MRTALVILFLCCAGVAPAQEFTTLKGHGGPIMGIAVAQDGQVATASFDNSVGLWTGRDPVWLEGHDAAVVAVRFLPDGRVVSGGDDFAIRLWDAPPRVLGRHKGKVTSLAVSPDRNWIASGSWDSTIGMWPTRPAFGSEIALHAGSGVNAVAWARVGNHDFVYAATSNGELFEFNLKAKGYPRRPIVKHGFGINQIVVTDRWIAYGAVDGGTRVVTAEGEEIADFTLDRRPILAMAYHAQTGQIAVGDGQGYIMMLDAREWKITRDFRATRKGPVWALAFSPDGQTIYAGGLDDVVYAWPVAMLNTFDPGINGERSFLREADSMPNGERQFMRKCSICHALEDGPSRKAGPTLHGIFGRRAGRVENYSYSPTLSGSDIVWDEDSVDALFDQGPDHYIPGSKMPMQVIRKQSDRADLIAFLKQATKGE